MEPRIDGTEFGSITVAGERIEHDIVIGLDGTVKKRAKMLSRSKYGTSHLISLAEAQYVHEDGARQLIVGAGQHGLVQLDEEAQRFLSDQGCHVRVLPTPEAVQAWNKAEGKVIGLFHVTC